MDNVQSRADCGSELMTAGPRYGYGNLEVALDSRAIVK
jgi:hypothetical protein